MAHQQIFIQLSSLTSDGAMDYETTVFMTAACHYLLQFA